MRLNYLITRLITVVVIPFIALIVSFFIFSNNDSINVKSIVIVMFILFIILFLTSFIIRAIMIKRHKILKEQEQLNTLGKVLFFLIGLTFPFIGVFIFASIGSDTSIRRTVQIADYVGIGTFLSLEIICVLVLNIL